MRSHNGVSLGEGEALVSKLRAVFQGETWWVKGEFRENWEAVLRIWEWDKCEEISLAVGELVEDPDPVVVEGALDFFLAAEEAEDCGALGRAVAKGKAPALKLAMATAQNPRRAAVVVAKLRESLLRQGFGAGLGVRMIAFDEEWIVGHAGEIVEASNDALGAITMNLQVMGRESEATSFVRNAASRVGEETVRRIIAETPNLGPRFAPRLLAALDKT